jgi:hypothetical protein
MSFPNNNQFESTLNRPINQPQTFFHLNPYPNIIQNNPYHYNMSPTTPYSTRFPGVTSVNQDQPYPNKDRRIYLKNFDELAEFLDKNYFHDSPPPDRVAYIRQNIFKELDIED